MFFPQCPVKKRGKTGPKRNSKLFFIIRTMVPVHEILFDPAYFFGHRDLLGADFRALPQGPASPGPLLPVEDLHPLIPFLQPLNNGDSAFQPLFLSEDRGLVYHQGLHLLTQVVGLFRAPLAGQEVQPLLHHWNRVDRAGTPARQVWSAAWQARLTGAVP
jgi:hypothetical protein